MEDNLKEPIHIEFYGLPGCGKSTVSHLVAKQLSQRGVMVREPSYNTDHNLNAVVRKVLKMSVTIGFCLKNYKDYKMLRNLTKENGYVSFGDSFKQIVNIAPKIRFYRKRKNVICLWDEGLVQSAISLAMNNEADIRNIEKKLFSIVKTGKIIKLYLKTDIETALQRMTGRSSSDSRIEKEADIGRKLVMMNRFEKCCEGIQGGRVLEEYSIEETIDKIIEWLA